MKTKRTTITINTGLLKKAEALMAAEDFGDFSGFVQDLIRQEWKRRHPVSSATAPDPDPEDCDTKAKTLLVGAVKAERRKRKHSGEA